MMRRICGINGILSSIDGCTNATDIANTFDNHFEQACLPNNSGHNNKLKINLRLCTVITALNLYFIGSQLN